MTSERQAVYRRAAKPLEARAQGVDIGTDAAEKQLLTFLASGIGKQHIQVDDFLSPENRHFAEMLLSGKNAAGMLEEIEDENERTRFARILDSYPDISEDEQMQAINDCLAVLRTKKRDQRVEQMKSQISGLDGEAKQEALRRMQEMIMKDEEMGKE